MNIIFIIYLLLLLLILIMNTNFEKVGEFHKCFEHPIHSIPRYNIFTEEPSLIKFRQSLIDEENEEFKDGCEKHNLIEVADGLTDMLYVIYGTGHALGLDLDKIFTEVHNSNMSKLCKSEEEAIETVEWYKLNVPRYEQPSYKKSKFGNFWLIYDQKTSKILKSINYKSPNIQYILNINSL